LFAYRHVQHTSSALSVRRPITCDVQIATYTQRRYGRLASAVMVCVADAM
jgi:hypothetical protein